MHLLPVDGCAERIKSTHISIVSSRGSWGAVAACYVRPGGLEPPRPKTLDPKSNAATNYATGANVPQRYNFFLNCRSSYRHSLPSVESSGKCKINESFCRTQLLERKSLIFS